MLRHTRMTKGRIFFQPCKLKDFLHDRQCSKKSDVNGLILLILSKIPCAERLLTDDVYVDENESLACKLIRLKKVGHKTTSGMIQVGSFYQGTVVGPILEMDWQ